MGSKLKRRGAVMFAILSTFLFTRGTIWADDASPSFQMDVAGRTWVATRSQIYKAAVGKSFALNINAFLQGSKISQLSFMIVPKAQGNFVQVYPLGEKANTGFFNVDVLGGDIMSDNFAFVFESGELAITAYDPTKMTISGTFSGKLKNHAGDGKIEIANGKFDGIEISK